MATFSLNPRSGFSRPTNIESYDDLGKRQHVCPIVRDFYYGQQDEYLENAWRIKGIDYSKFTIAPVNITKKIIEARAILYKEAPERLIVDKDGQPLEEAQNTWNQIMEITEYNRKMRQSEEYSDLEGTVIALVCPEVENHQETEEYKKKVVPNSDQVLAFESFIPIQIHIAHPDMVDVRTTLTNEIAEICYSLGDGEFYGFESPLEDAKNSYERTVTMDKDGQSLHQATVIYWSPKSHARYKKGDDKTNFDNPNIYGVIPAVAIHRIDPAPGTFWQAADENLIYNNQSVNMMLSIADHLIKYQSGSQPWLSNFNVPIQELTEFSQSKEELMNATLGTPSDDWQYTEKYLWQDKDRGRARKKLTFGVDTPLLLPHGTEFGYTTPDPKFVDVYSILATKLAILASTYNLSADIFQLKATPEAGISLLIRRTGLVDYNFQKQRLFEVFERNLFDKIRAIWNHHHPDKMIPLDAQMKIKWSIYKVPLDPVEEIDKYIKEVKLGVRKRSEVIQLVQKEKNLSIQQAEQYLKEVIEENKNLPIPNQGQGDVMSPATETESQ